MYRGLPPDIGSKRSWSAVVKEGKARKRLAALQAAADAIDDRGTAEAVLKKLGLF